MNVIIKSDSSHRDDLDPDLELSAMKLLLDIGDRLKSTKYDDLWKRFFQAVTKFSPMEQLRVIQNTYGYITHRDLRKLIEALFEEEALRAFRRVKPLKIGRIPFELEQLNAAKSAGLMLSCWPDVYTLSQLQKEMQGVPDWRGFKYSSYINSQKAPFQIDTTSFYHTTTSRCRYNLVGQIGEAHFNGNYFEQTEQLADWLAKNINICLDPGGAKKALDEFHSEKDKPFHELMINKFFRESAVEVVMRLWAAEKAQRSCLIHSDIIATSDVYNGKVVYIGSIDYKGIQILLKKPSEKFPGYIRSFPVIC